MKTKKKTKTRVSAKPMRYRLNLELPQKTKERLDRLLEISECDAQTELIRWAIATYDDLLETQNEGGRVILQRPGERDVELRIK